jgi:hypothetical protein
MSDREVASMSEPEIARRCTHCGVSLRQSALFCPQCGHELGDSKLSEIVSEKTPPTVPLASEPPSSPRVAGNVRERVEKIRHVSSVVIDQAAYDPSLRFILVAAGVFIIFLVLLILSKVIG